MYGIFEMLEGISELVGAKVQIDSFLMYKVVHETSHQTKCLFNGKRRGVVSRKAAYDTRRSIRR